MSKRLKVILVAGPRSSGKSALVRMIAPQLCPQPPHYLRLVSMNGAPRMTLLGDLKSANLATWKRVNYNEEQLFDFLPQCLEEIAETHSSPIVLLEADTDPSLRYAYPYDYRIFVMPKPRQMGDVFRTPAQAAEAIREVMNDTAAFASEIYGLFDSNADAGDSTAHVEVLKDRAGVAEERVTVTPVQMKRFMRSPLGMEIASRIQLQPDYHGLVDSDLILVNTAVGGQSDMFESCMKQLRNFLSRLVAGRITKPMLFWCNPLDFADPVQYQLLKRIQIMLEH